MDLTREEQKLIEEFRKLPPAYRDELLAHAASLLRRSSEKTAHEPESAQNQCRLKGSEPRPETEKIPYSTE